MHRISLPDFLTAAKRPVIHDWGSDPDDEEEGISIEFPVKADVSRRRVLVSIRRHLAALGITWLTTNSGTWTIDLDDLRRQNEPFGQMTWLQGQITVEPEIHWTHDGAEERVGHFTHVYFVVTRSGVTGQ